MFNIVLVHPEIPPNTGNVIRLAANTGCALHLIEPLGFSMDDRQLKRAGLDYHEYAAVQRHGSWADFLVQTRAAQGNAGPPQVSLTPSGPSGAPRGAEPGRRTVPADWSSPGEGHRACKPDGGLGAAQPWGHSEPRLFAFTTRATKRFDTQAWQRGDWLVFGSETAGLPDAVRAAIPAERCLRLPMRPGQRSLNLSNAVAVVVFEAWRQIGYEGAA